MVVNQVRVPIKVINRVLLIPTAIRLMEILRVIRLARVDILLEVTDTDVMEIPAHRNQERPIKVITALRVQAQPRPVHIVRMGITRLLVVNPVRVLIAPVQLLHGIPVHPIIPIVIPDLTLQREATDLTIIQEVLTAVITRVATIPEAIVQVEVDSQAEVPLAGGAIVVEEAEVDADNSLRKSNKEIIYEV